MRTTRGHPGIVIRTPLRFASQGENFGGNFLLTTVRMVGNMYELSSVEVAALIIHARVSPSGVFAKGVIKEDQRLDDDLPGSLANILYAADGILNAVRSFGILKQPAAPVYNLFEQHQLQHRNQGPELCHFEHGDFLKALDIGSESGFAEAIV